MVRSPAAGRRMGRMGRKVGAALGATLMALTAPVLSAPHEPAESLVVARSDMFDPEYNQARAKVTWVDRKGRLWVADIDRKTGLFKPRNGRGTLVDDDALTTTDQVMVGNGPEWLSALGPDRIVYTKFAPGQPHEREHARLAVAEQAFDGQWTHRLLSPLPLLRPYASTDARDPRPRISYVDPEGLQYWREVDNPDSQDLVQAMPKSRALSMRFVQGQRATVFVTKVLGDKQVVRYWHDFQRLEQLTFDGGHDGASAPFMWQAPEFDNDYVVMVLYNQAQELRIYRQLDKSMPQWSVIHRVTAPPGTKFISSESFTAEGKSYVFMSATTFPGNLSSTIYISNIDASEPLFRQLTPDEPLRKRTDPEVFATTEGTFVYFNRVNRSDEGGCPCYEGVYRSDTGLGPPVAMPRSR